MASHSAIESASNGFLERGRTLKGTYTVDLAEASHRPEFQSLIGHPDGVSHLDVVVANGPFGPEVLILPRAGQHGLPGELYAQVAGAFGAPAAYDKASGDGLAWTSTNASLQEYLQTHQFGANTLPGGQRDGQHTIDMDWTVQIIALGAAQSIVACQLSADEPSVVALALSAIDRLAQVTSQSQASGAQGGLHPFRFGFVVELALNGQLVSPPPPPAPIAQPVVEPVAVQPPPPAPVVEDVIEPVAVPPAPVGEPVVEPIAGVQDTLARESFDRTMSVESGLAAVDTFSIEDAELDPESLYDMSATSWGASASGVETIDTQARLTEALGRYEGKRVIVGAITDQKRLANVQRGIDAGVEPEAICGFVDTGARSNGKSGMVFTETALHFCGLSSRLHYDYGTIESFSLETAAVIITGSDGTRAKISASGQQALAIAEAISAATGLSV